MIVPTNHCHSLCRAGVIMKDLIALETAVPDYVEHGRRKLINFRKMVQLRQILSDIVQLNVSRPAVKPRKELVHMLRVSLYFEFSLFFFSQFKINRQNS